MTSVQVCLSVSHAHGASLSKAIDIAAEAGFRCLDLSASLLEGYLAEYPVSWLNARLDEHDVYVAAISQVELALARPTGLVSTRPDDERMVAHAHFLELCARLDALGGGLISVHSGPGPDPEIDERAQQALAVRALRDLSDLAAPFEVRVVFEARSARRSSESSLSANQEVIRLAGRNNLGLALNTLHFWLDGGTSQELDALDPGALALVHLEDFMALPSGSADAPHRTLPGRGVVPLSEICGRLVAGGFRGPYSVTVPTSEKLTVSGAVYAREAALEVLAPLRTWRE